MEKNVPTQKYPRIVVQTEKTVFTQEYPLEVIQTAQYLGAQVIKEPFFPRWLVNQFAEEGLVEVEFETDMETDEKFATVRVWSRDRRKSKKRKILCTVD